MSDQPSAGNQLQSDAINFSAIARNHLAQFAAAAAKNYKPVAQSQPITESSTTPKANESVSTTSSTTSTTTAPTASNSGSGTHAASNSSSGTYTASNAGSGTHAASNAGSGTYTASNAGSGTYTASNAGSGTYTASNSSSGTPAASNSGASNSGASNSTVAKTNNSSQSQKSSTTNTDKTPNSSSNAVTKSGGATGGSHFSVTGSSIHDKKHEIFVATPFKSPMIETFDTSKVQGCKFVLLDPYIEEVTDSYEQVTGTFQWEVCKDQTNRCLEFIKNQCADKRVFLVCSGGLGQSAVPQLHDLPQLYAVYVYCGNVMFHKEWAANYKKVRMVCDNDKNYLIPQLALDVAQSNLEWAVDILKKGGDKEKAKKKLTQALKNTEHHMKANAEPELEKEIRRKLEECK